MWFRWPIDNSFYQIRFIDSFRFIRVLHSESLVKNLTSFNGLKSEFRDRDIKLLIEKGIYPYEYMDSFARFEERQLPNKNAFYSSLTGKHISDEEYERAQKVWHEFHIQNLLEYTLIYLKTDVMLFVLRTISSIQCIFWLHQVCHGVQC